MAEVSSAREQPELSQLHQRKGSAAAVELTDERGRRRTVQLDMLSDADRELAEKFGYNPVCAPHPTVCLR